MTGGELHTGAWEDLARRASAPPWLYPQWVLTWCECFGAGRPEIVTEWRGGRLVGVLPLLRRRGELRSPANGHTPEFGALFEDDAAGSALAQKLIYLRARRIALFYVREDHPSLGHWRSTLQSHGYRVLEQTLERSPYVAIDRPWEDYEAGLPRKMLREMRRRRKLLERSAEVSYEVTETADDVVLEDGFAVEASGWKGKQATAIATSPATVKFYRRIVRWAEQEGWLRLGALRAGDRMVAFDLSFEAHGSHHLLKTGFDAASARYGVGKLIRYESLRSTFLRGLRSYEFLGLDEDWKREWTDTSRRLILLRGFAPSPTGVVDWAAYRHGRRLLGRAPAES